MSAAITREMDAFKSFLSQQEARGIVFVMPEESVKAYREYERQLTEFQKLLKPALEQSARGETFEMDRDVFKSDVLRRLEKS